MGSRSPPKPDGWVHFGAVAATSSVRLTVSMEGEEAGALGGRIIAADARGYTAQLPIRTFVYP